jgi:uncharacterized protein
MDREDLGFHSGGERCAAWLYRPAGDRPAPCVVLGHGFGATRAGRLWAYAERFAAAGIAALAFDYRHFGDSEGEPRQLLDIRRQLADWRAALAFARSLDGIDPTRVALWGSSFGGGHAVRVAAGNPQVAAVVSQIPFTTGVSVLRTTGIRQSVRLTAEALRDVIAGLRGREPHLVPVVGEPGELAAITTPDAVPGYASLYGGEPAPNQVAARILLRLTTYNPAWWASRVRCPLLVCIADEDALTPPRPAERMAARAPRAEAVHYPTSHFEIYAGEWFERVVADQTEFLVRHLLGAKVEVGADVVSRS